MQLTSLLNATCLQHTSLSPDGKLLVIVGDNPEGILVDSQTGKVVFFPISVQLKVYDDNRYSCENAFS